jgi:hypothetical protein
VFFIAVKQEWNPKMSQHGVFGEIGVQRSPIHTPLLLALGFVALSPLYGWTLIRVAGIPLLRPDLLITVFIVMYASVKILQRGRLQLDRAGLLLIGLIALTTVSNVYEGVLNPQQVVDMTTTYVQLLLLVALFVSFSNLGLTVPDIRTLLRVWVIVATGVAVFGIYQGIARVYSLPLAELVFNIPAPGTVQRVGYSSTYPAFFRVASVFTEPAWYGTYLVPPAIVSLFAVAYHGRGRFLFDRRLVSWGVFLILTFGIVQSASVLSYLTFALTLVLYVVPVLLREDLLGTDKVLISGGVCGVGVLLIPALRRIVLEIVVLPAQVLTWLRTGNVGVLDVASAQYRLRIALETVELWMEQSLPQKFFGIGLNSLENNPNIPFESTPGAYTQILIDLGIFGELLFITFLVVVLKQTYTSRLLDHAESGGGTTPSSTKFVSVALIGVVVSTAIMFGQIGHIRPVRWSGLFFAAAFVVAMDNS